VGVDHADTKKHYFAGMVTRNVANQVPFGYGVREFKKCFFLNFSPPVSFTELKVTVLVI